MRFVWRQFCEFIHINSLNSFEKRFHERIHTAQHSNTARSQEIIWQQNPKLYVKKGIKTEINIRVRTSGA